VCSAEFPPCGGESNDCFLELPLRLKRIGLEFYEGSNVILKIFVLSCVIELIVSCVIELSGVELMS
jgi:hypothetical protein